MKKYFLICTLMCLALTSFAQSKTYVVFPSPSLTDSVLVDDKRVKVGDKITSDSKISILGKKNHLRVFDGKQVYSIRDSGKLKELFRQKKVKKEVAGSVF